MLEWDDVSDLRRQNVDADTIRAGDEVIVTGIAAREAKHSLYIERIDRPADGLVYVDD
jgi:hydrogenase maturation factor